MVHTHLIPKFQVKNRLPELPNKISMLEPSAILFHLRKRGSLNLKVLVSPLCNYLTCFTATSISIRLFPSSPIETHHWHHLSKYFLVSTSGKQFLSFFWFELLLVSHLQVILVSPSGFTLSASGLLVSLFLFWAFPYYNRVACVLQHFLIDKTLYDSLHVEPHLYVLKAPRRVP